MKQTRTLVFLAIFLGLGFAACERKPRTVGEAVGETIDDALDQRRGEKVKDAVEDVRDAARDAKDNKR